MIKTGIIHCGDCAEVMSQMPAECIDLVVTSPPYDGLRDYNGYTFDFPRVATELARLLKPGGVIVWNIADQTIDGSETGTSFRQALFFKDECGLRLHDTMIFHKHTKPLAMTKRYYSAHEYMFVLSKGEPKTANLIKDTPNKTAGEMKKYYGTFKRDGKKQKGIVRRKISPEFRARSNVWYYAASDGGVMGTTPGKSRTAANWHPAKMHEHIARDHIITWTDAGEVVLDPFMGSGTTGIAAVETGREWVGIEISEHYTIKATASIQAAPPPLPL